VHQAYAGSDSGRRRYLPKTRPLDDTEHVQFGRFLKGPSEGSCGISGGALDHLAELADAPAAPRLGTMSSFCGGTVTIRCSPDRSRIHLMIDTQLACLCIQSKIFRNMRALKPLKKGVVADHRARAFSLFSGHRLHSSVAVQQRASKLTLGHS